MAARVAANARTVCVKRSRGWIGTTMAPALRHRAWAAHSGLAPCCAGASTPHHALAVARAAASRQFATATQAVPAATAVPGAASRKPQSYMVVRFVDIDGNESYGTLESAKKAGSAGAGAGAESTRGYVPAELDKVYHARPIQQMGDRGHAWKTLDEQLRVARFLPPVEPVAIYCIGLNYHKHALETGLTVPKYPTMFLKPVTSVIAHRHEIVIPSVARDPPEVDFEGELAIIIGRDCKNVSVDEALNYVLGYTIANDVSARRWQGKKGGGQWCRSKAFDTFCPLGPGVVPSNVVDPDNLRITTRLNGEVMQDSNTSDMVFSVAEIVSFLSQDTTLLHGTVILTGTPEGVGFTRDPPVFLSPGDVVEVSIEGLGTLVNPVVAEATPSSRWHAPQPAATKVVPPRAPA